MTWHFSEMSVFRDEDQPTISTMKGEVQAKRVLLAKRLFFAESSMHQAGSLAQYAFDKQVGKLQDVFVPLMGGICVAYARPFLRADGLGPLDEKYAKMSESAMQETHDDLLRIRHTLYAHRDLTRTIAWNPATQTSEAMHGVTLFFDGRNDYRFATHEPTYRDINLPTIILLCEHQRARIAVERHKVVDKLCRGVCPARGVYELGIQFPTPRKKG